MCRLASANFLAYVAHVVLPSTFVLYAGYRYGWDESAVGLCLSAVGISAIIVQAGLIGPIVKRVGDRRAMLIGQCDIEQRCRPRIARSRPPE